MNNIKELRANLESFKKSRATDVRSYAGIQKYLRDTELEFEALEKDLALHREKSDKFLRDSLLLKQEKEALSAQVSRLSKEKTDLESQLAVLQRARPALSSANLVDSFKTSLYEMNRGLKKAPERTKYHVNSLNVKLRANLALDGAELKFQMPKPDDIIPPENLSEIEFTLREVPDKAGFSGYREVPDLAGLSMEVAESELLDSGFRPGEVIEKESGAPQGTVLAQLPSAHSLAEPKAPVDLVVSRFSSVKVPSLLGLELESAKKVIEKSRLRPGEIKKQVADTKPGIVIAQSLRPGSDVDVMSEVSLVVSTKKPSFRENEKELSGKEVNSLPKKPGDTSNVLGSLPRKPPVVSRAAASAFPVRDAKKVPRVVGMHFKEAVEALEREGIKAGKISEINSRISTGIVIEQGPRAGTIANPRIPVDLVVSKGPLSLKSSKSG